jgi:hypothetical protein
MFLLISGFFSSIDLIRAIFGKLEKTNKNTIFYWIGLLFGLSIPMIILVIVYSILVLTNVSTLEKYEITDDPLGQNKVDVTNEKKSLDIASVMLFIVLIYAFVAVLFTIKRESFSPIIYNGIITIILAIISIFMYLLYSLIPFFNSADTIQVNKITQSLRMFINSQNPDNPNANIVSNQQDDNSLRFCFVATFIAVFILTLIYFSLKTENSFINGIFGSCAILTVPALWLLNFSIGIQFFFAYPLILVFFRFIRYSYMSILYILFQKSPTMRDRFSDDLVQKLTNFKNYSPTWGLLGVDELKVWLNMNGYNNDFSASILSENSNNLNLSSNKYIAGMFGLQAMKDNNISGMVYSIAVWVLAIIVTVIILNSI